MGEKNYYMDLRSSDRRTTVAWNNQIGLELEDTKKFENMLHDKMQELEIELEDSNTASEKEVLLNEIDTLKGVMGHLFNLKPGGNETRATEIAGPKIISTTLNV